MSILAMPKAFHQNFRRMISVCLCVCALFFVTFHASLCNASFVEMRNAMCDVNVFHEENEFEFVAKRK